MQVGGEDRLTLRVYKPAWAPQAPGLMKKPTMTSTKPRLQRVPGGGLGCHMDAEGCNVAARMRERTCCREYQRSLRDRRSTDALRHRHPPRRRLPAAVLA
mmetsp:Transcript_52787/g.94938  ORF Transcript_52787/g.94938 Transcript_52787/m.94938 type:complete len:100 (-) Transcript_52787:701-1000(-)